MWWDYTLTKHDCNGYTLWTDFFRLTPHSHCRRYLLRLVGFRRWQNHFQGRHIPSEIWCILHTTGGIIRGYRHSTICPVLQLLSEFYRRPCDTMAKHPFTSTCLMSLYFTERWPSHNLTHTVDYTLWYSSKKFICTSSLLSVHAHGSKIRGGNFKHFKGNAQGNERFVTVSHGRIQTSDGTWRTGTFYPTAWM